MPSPDAEGGTKPPDRVVESDPRFDQVPACGNHGADAMCRRRLDVHLLVEPRARQLG